MPEETSLVHADLNLGDMNRTVFSIIYDGEPISEGTIDARDLAPCLLAFADLIDVASPLVDASLPHLSLRVRSNFKEGSFEVFLQISSILQKFVSIFSGNEATAICNLLTIIGVIGGAKIGLFQLIKKFKGKKPTSVTIQQDKVVVIFEGEVIDVDLRVWAIFQNLSARQAVEKVISPLINRGFDLFKIRYQGTETLQVNESESSFFVAPSNEEDEAITSHATTWLEIVAPSFNPDNKWRVSDGGRTLHVTIQDTDFQNKVQQSKELFGKGDRLQADLSTTQRVVDGKLTAEYALIKVYQHIPRQDPLNLFS